MSEHQHITRRQFGLFAGGALASLALSGNCQGGGGEGNDGRITARPRAGIGTSRQGQQPLGLGSARDGVLHVPGTSDGLVPLLVLLHGAGGSGAAVLKRLGGAPDRAGVAILAPDSRAPTWDVIRGSFGADVEFINASLSRTFASVAVDPARLAIGGFSDGATYALSLGLTNGDLFRRVAAFSPGFLATGTPQGKPEIFISHGTDDPILPIGRCGRAIAATLRDRGYHVAFREFAGGHEIPADIARDAMSWVAVR